MKKGGLEEPLEQLKAPHKVTAILAGIFRTARGELLRYTVPRADGKQSAIVSDWKDCA